MQLGAMASAQSVRSRRIPSALSVLAAAARIAWRVVRMLLLALLTLLEPVIRAVFSLAMVLGILAATVFELSAAGSQFEFLQMFVGSLGLGAALFAYHGLLAFLSR